MQAKDLMTTDVVTIDPDMHVDQIAQVLLEHGISAVPVVDATGAPVGMVSEGDLIGRDDTERDARRDWWLEMLAGAEAPSPEDLETLHPDRTTAKSIMAGPVVTATETTEAAEIARLLAAHRIKRVPVVRDGHIVGIISRADLLRALVQARPTEQPAEKPKGRLAKLFTGIDQHFLHPGHGLSGAESSGAAEARGEEHVSAAEFRSLVSDFKHERADRARKERVAVASRRKARVKDLIDHHIHDDNWQAMMHDAREAAERGEKSVLLLRFPSQLCSDGGRAINAPEPDWPNTLRGEAAELYLRWEHDLKPHGFHLEAKVLEFPGGYPGDVGLFLVWGE